MKKILGVIVLGLLLGGCATGISDNVQSELIKGNKINIGMTYTELKPLMTKNQMLRSTPNNQNQFLTIGETGYESWGIHPYIGNIILLEQKDESKQVGGFTNKNLANYKVIKIYSSEEHLDYYDFILQIPNITAKSQSYYTILKGVESARIKKKNDTKMLATKSKKAKTEKTKNELLEMINKAKDTCKTLGFKEDTDKFSDCTLKLYSQEVDNKVALKVAKQKASSSSSSSSSGSMIIYDPVRDRQNQIDRGMKMLSGGCTLGIDC